VAQLNAEWLELHATAAVNLTGMTLSHLTFDRECRVTGQEVVVQFSAGTLTAGQRLRLHTGSGANGWNGGTYHMYLGHDWYIWNNGCGDRATIMQGATKVDTAGYAPRPPEGVLVRRAGTDLLVPAPALLTTR
jgi:hypothetical protein